MNHLTHFNPRALLISIGFFVVLAVVLSSPGSGWFHFAEVLATLGILLGIVGLVRERRAR